jgi:hypothetical protein
MLRYLPGSLRIRLTALIVLYASVAFAISGFAVYEAMMSRVEANAADQMEEVMSALEVHLSGLKSTAGITRDPDTWKEHVHGREYMAFAIFDMAGKDLLATRGFRNYSPVLDVQTPHNPVTLFASFKSRVGGLAGQVRASARRSEHLTRVEKVSWDMAGCGRMRQPAMQDNANTDEPDPTL